MKKLFIVTGILAIAISVSAYTITQDSLRVTYGNEINSLSNSCVRGISNLKVFLDQLNIRKTEMTTKKSIFSTDDIAEVQKIRLQVAKALGELLNTQDNTFKAEFETYYNCK